MPASLERKPPTLGAHLRASVFLRLLSISRRVKPPRGCFRDPMRWQERRGRGAGTESRGARARGHLGLRRGPARRGRLGGPRAGAPPSPAAQVRCVGPARPSPKGQTKPGKYLIPAGEPGRPPRPPQPSGSAASPGALLRVVGPARQRSTRAPGGWGRSRRPVPRVASPSAPPAPAPVLSLEGPWRLPLPSHLLGAACGFGLPEGREEEAAPGERESERRTRVSPPWCLSSCPQA